MRTGDSLREASDSGQFPTLAEQLKVDEQCAQAVAEPRPVLVLFEGSIDSERVRRQLARAQSEVPTASLVGVVSEGVAHTEPAHAAAASGLDRAAEIPVRDLDGVRALLDTAPDADLVVVTPPHELTRETLERLRRAGELDTVCASVSDVSPEGDGGAPGSEPGVPPFFIQHPKWGVVLVRRDALEVALENARAASDTTATEDGALRDLLSGVLATPGLVHRGSPGDARTRSEADGPNRRLARTSRTLKVTMDVRSLLVPVSGTHVQLINLMKGLVATGELELTALTPTEIHPSAHSLVEPLRENVKFTLDAPSDADVFHHPSQFYSRLEVIECLRYGRRLVLTHQDMILDHTPEYFYSPEIWQEFRRATRAALAAADHVGFFSKHAALDAASEGLLDPERATVVPLGVDHMDTTGEGRLPSRVAALGRRPFLLMIGVPLAHKNRVFALRVLRELVDHAWNGALVFAGGDFPWGNSREDERVILERDPELRARVLDVGYVTEAEKRALYRDAALVLFPSLYEGFGLVPFEAAAYGTGCLYAWRGPMREFLPSVGALPEDLSAASTSTRVLEILGEPTHEADLVSAIRSAAAALTWDRTARGYLEVYRRAVAVDRRLLDRGTLEGSELTAKEQLLMSVYRHRPAFAIAVDQMMRAGTAVMTSRLGRAWDARARRKRAGH
jgi:glycosyltransferase involved in cell wall biosynthesis